MPLWNWSDSTDVARLKAQARRLVAAYEDVIWPRRPPSVAGLIRHLLDRHGLTHLGEAVFRGARRIGVAGWPHGLMAHVQASLCKVRLS